MTFAPQWQEIRALRAVPTHLATSDPERRRTFSAALRQAEELARAAEVAGYATKALTLFYSLSQAGRAIAAARLQGAWKLFGHGLSVTPVEKPMLETIVKPTPGRSDSFHQVAKAIGSPALAGQTQLGAIWAANPDLREVPPPSAGSWLAALEIPLGMETSPMLDPRRIDLSQPTLTTGGVVVMPLDVAGVTGQDIEKNLARYPTLRDAFGIVQGPTGERRGGPTETVHREPDYESGVMRAHIAKPFPVQSNMLDYWVARRTFASIVEVDSRHPHKPYPHYLGFALPEVEGDICPHPLMMWWALLLGLSSLTRYESAGWTDAIDLDSSELAVSLERVLDIASEKVPHRILSYL